MRCIHMGLLCVQEQEEDRPRMSAAVLMLSSHSLSHPVPARSAFVTISVKSRHGNKLRSLQRQVSWTFIYE